MSKAQIQVGQWKSSIADPDCFTCYFLPDAGHQSKGTIAGLVWKLRAGWKWTAHSRKTGDMLDFGTVSSSDEARTRATEALTAEGYLTVGVTEREVPHWSEQALKIREALRKNPPLEDEIRRMFLYEAEE